MHKSACDWLSLHINNSVDGFSILLCGYDVGVSTDSLQHSAQNKLYCIAKVMPKEVPLTKYCQMKLCISFLCDNYLVQSSKWNIKPMLVRCPGSVSKRIEQKVDQLNQESPAGRSVGGSEKTQDVK